MNATFAVLVLGSAGAVTGSFVSTAALRTARGEQVLGGRSHCDGCDRSLSLVETIPLVSYVAGRGRCSSCRSKINPAHPLSEMAGAAAAIALGLTLAWPAAFLLCVLGAALLAASLIDIRTQRLPNVLTLLVAVCAALLAARKGLGELRTGVIAAAIAAVVLILVRQVFLRFRGDPSLGLGDVKLIAALALWLGPLTAEMVAGAALIALVLHVASQATSDRLPFGPMLASAAWCMGVTMELGLWPK
jgi:leader peptidase (prepilin peptidase)/N-methyltransferase